MQLQNFKTCLFAGDFLFLFKKKNKNKNKRLIQECIFDLIIIFAY